MKIKLTILFSLLSLALLAQPIDYQRVVDNCSSIIVYDSVSGHIPTQETYSKTGLHLHIAPGINVSITSDYTAFHPAFFTPTTVQYFAPTLDSAYALLRPMFAYSCTQCAGATEGPTGPTGPTGPRGADTIQCIQSIAVTVTAAQIRHSHDTPVVIIPAPAGSGQITVLNITATLFNATSAYSPSTGNLFIGDTVTSFVDYSGTTAQMLAGGINGVYNYSLGSNYGTIGAEVAPSVAGFPLIFYTPAVNPSEGNGDIRFTIIYTVTDTSGHTLCSQDTFPYGGSINVYNSDGTLTGNRTVDLGGQTLKLDGETYGLRIDSLYDNLECDKGTILATSNIAFIVVDTAGKGHLGVDVSHQKIGIPDYPASRNDTATYKPVNFLYTDTSGILMSSPIISIQTMLSTLPAYANDAAAQAGGLRVGYSYYSTTLHTYTRREL